MFKRITELGEDNREVRRPTPLAEIAAVAGASTAEVEDCISHFAEPGRSFVTVSGDGVVDISHESLIRQWPRLKAWVHEEAESRDIYGRLADSADRWEPARGRAAPGSRPPDRGELVDSHAAEPGVGRSVQPGLHASGRLPRAKPASGPTPASSDGRGRRNAGSPGRGRHAVRALGQPQGGRSQPSHCAGPAPEAHRDLAAAGGRVDQSRCSAAVPEHPGGGPSAAGDGTGRAAPSRRRGGVASGDEGSTRPRAAGGPGPARRGQPGHDRLQPGWLVARHRRRRRRGRALEPGRARGPAPGAPGPRR